MEEEISKDTRWEEALADILKDEHYGGDNPAMEKALKKLRENGWKLSYPDGWPDLCDNCKSYIDEGTWHSVFNGNFWGSCEIHKGEPRGLVARIYADEDGNWPLVPYWGDPKTKNEKISNE